MGQEVQTAKFGVIFNIIQLWATLSENLARCLNSETNLVSVDDRPMSSASLVEFGPRRPRTREKWELSGESDPPPKIGRRLCHKSSIKSRGLIDFALILYNV